jgi:mannose-6-phosphate isomerase-like protein (cupin superfamily)
MAAYSIHTDVKHGPLELVDAGALARACREPWWNQTLCRVNESVIRLGVFHGEFHWHKHDREDEFFFVLEGRLFVDLEGSSVELGREQGFVVPRGVVHRTRASERTVVLMVEPATVSAVGDCARYLRPRPPPPPRLPPRAPPPPPRPRHRRTCEAAGPWPEWPAGPPPVDLGASPRSPLGCAGGGRPSGDRP